MAKLPSTADRLAFEKVVAHKLGLDLTQIIAGSISIESTTSLRGSNEERVTWRGAASAPSGFMAEVFNEANGR